MESIQELRKLLQEEKVNPTGWRRPWGYKTFQRGPSIYITRLILPYRIRPNQVTIVGIILGLAGCLLIAQFDLGMKFAGLALLYLNILSDKVDGEIARYKKIFSLRGIYWDEINHLVVPPLFWISLTRGILIIPLPDGYPLLLSSLVGAFSLVLLRVVHSLPAQIFAKKYLKHPEFFTFKYDEIPRMGTSEKISWFQNIGRALHAFQDFFILVVSVAVLLVFEKPLRADMLFHPFLVYFIFVVNVLLTLFALEVIIKKSRSVEQEIKELAERTRK